MNINILGISELKWMEMGEFNSDDERVTGRKASGLQMEERGCKCQTFLSLLIGRKKQTIDVFFLSIQI